VVVVVGSAGTCRGDPQGRRCRGGAGGSMCSKFESLSMSSKVVLDVSR
jgi:hypothetical protein